MRPDDLNLPSTVLDPQTWPITGRAGVCRAGEAMGSFIFLHLATEDREPSLAYWQAFLRPPLVPGSDGELFVDNASGAMKAFVDSADVQWAPDDLDAAWEDANLGLRRIFASNGSFNYSERIERLDASDKADDSAIWFPQD